MRSLAILILMLALMLPGGAVAQTEDGATDGDDRGRIVQFLEDQLSGGARQVTIEGFRGALSASAEMDLLTIADAEGVWLRLEGARLDWSRAALLRGALQIDALHADRLTILRAPLPDPGLDLPPAEATPFQLPQLPVSIAIGQVSLDHVVLGAPLMGSAVALSVQGSAALADGAGNADLDITRLDGPEARFTLAAAYANDTRQLSLSLLLAEAAGGLLATRLSLPDAPAIRFSAMGAGPIDDFTAQISLDSDDAPRLRGTITSRFADATGERNLTADVGGDITPLFLPDYRAFFGPDVALSTRLRLLPDGAVSLDRLRVTAAKLALNGRMSLAPGGVPQAFDLSLRMADPTGQGPVRLPVPGAEITIDAADLRLHYDAATSEAYTAQGQVSRLQTETLSLDRLGLEASGRIVDGPAGLGLEAPIGLTIAGLSHADPALSQALGDSGQLNAQLSWTQGAPVVLRDLAVRAGDIRLTGRAALGLGEARAALDTDLTLEIASLSRFAALSGQPLAGRLAANLALSIEMLSGAFDMVLTGTGRDMRLAEALPPALFAGTTQVSLSALRDPTGLTLRGLTLTGDQIDLRGDGQANSGGATLSLTGRLANIGLFTDALSGPVSASLEASRGPDTDPWQMRADVASGAGLTATLTGSVAPEDGSVDLTARGQVPLALANRALAPQSLFGTVAFDLAMRGAPGLSAVSGNLRTSNARLTLPLVQTALENLSATGQIANGQITLAAQGTLATGGTLSGDGTLALDRPGLPAQINVTGRNLRLVDPRLYEARIDRADIAITGALSGDLQIAGTVALGETALRLPETGLGGSAPIPPITHLGETAAERRTRIAAGLGPTPRAGAGGSQRIGLDVTIDAPGRVFVRGRGVDAELGGTLRIGGTTARVIPAGRLDLIRGRLSVLGTRLDLTEGAATLEGNFDPFIRLIAATQSGDYQIGISMVGPVSAPEIALNSSPALPEDEIFAQLLFGRSISALSPLQLLQLADAATGLAGGSAQGGLFDRLRTELGLDDLDLQTDAEGNAALRAGRYLSENVYTDVTLGGDDAAGLSLNIDLTDDITARGRVSATGDSRIGVFYERDY